MIVKVILTSGKLTWPTAAHTSRFLHPRTQRKPHISTYKSAQNQALGHATPARRARLLARGAPRSPPPRCASSPPAPSRLRRRGGGGGGHRMVQSSLTLCSLPSLYDVKVAAHRRRDGRGYRAHRWDAPGASLCVRVGHTGVSAGLTRADWAANPAGKRHKKGRRGSGEARGASAPGAGRAKARHQWQLDARQVLDTSRLSTAARLRCARARWQRHADDERGPRGRPSGRRGSPAQKINLAAARLHQSKRKVKLTAGGWHSAQ